jgi:hypothetical protein
MTRLPQRAAPAARAGLLIAGVAVSVGWAAGSPVETWRALMLAVDGPPPTTGFDQLLGSSAAFAAWVCLGWLCITVLLEVASTLPGTVGRGCAAIAARTSPMLVRRMVQAVIGLSVLAGPMSAGSAFATGPSTTTSTSTELDRPISTVAPTLTANRAAPGISTAPPNLDRPAAAFIPSAPPVATRTAVGRAALVTGTAHRDAGDPSDRGYVVRRGDTLWDIAARHLGPNASSVDISRAWPKWYDANHATIGPDPSMITPGEVLVPPSSPSASSSTAPSSTASNSTAPVGTR